jgi:ABC-2 type transport system ATP-binding protein
VGSRAVEIEGLHMAYGRTRAVDGLDLVVETGGVSAVLGPNGAGKTTTIETCEGYRRPHRGTVRVLGLDPARDHRALAPRVGVMLQQGGTWSAARAEEALRYVASLYRHPLDVATLVDRLGLGSCGRTPYRRLSGGQQQRLALATALVGRPELVFLDEPTAGLDPQARHDTWDLVDELATAGVTIVLTTHHIDEAERLARQVFVVDRGRVVASGSPAELTANRAADTISFRPFPPIDPDDLRTVLPIGCALSESHGDCVVTGSITPDLLAAVTAWCAAAGVMPQGLTVGRTTLEDVFLALTSGEARS